MVSVVIHSKFGYTVAKPMVCVEIEKSIPESELTQEYELQACDGDQVQAPAEDSDVLPPE